MKSREEIEEKIGFKIEYDEWTTYTQPNDWNNFMGEAIKHRKLKPPVKETINSLFIESLQSGDMETASVCGEILRSTEMEDEERLELQRIENESIQQIITDIGELDEDSIEDIEKKLDKIRLTKDACIHIDKETNQILDEKEKELRQALHTKVEERITSLDEQIKGLSRHIEIPENEEKINQLQAQIESLEEKYYPNRIKTSHKARRIQEQGAEMSEIMKDISEYKAVNLGGRDSSDYYLIRFNELNRKIAKKTEYLEQKLALLQRHKDIPGNEERIAEIETQLETMQDAWIVAQKGYNNIDGIIETAKTRMSEFQRRIDQNKKELETVDPLTIIYLQKQKEIENDEKEVKRYEQYIERISQTKEEIESGTNISFMGQHHRDRLQREEQERIDKNRERIQELDLQIAELTEHIEIPENEQKIIELQEEIDEIESTIPSDRGNHKRARLQEQGRSTEQITDDINNIIARYNDPYIDGYVRRIDEEIKIKVSYLENISNHLKEHLDIPENRERIEDIQRQIEQLEDQWKLFILGFGSKEQAERTIIIKKAHLYNDLTSFGAEKGLELSAEQMQEYWKRMQEGEQIPELLGRHHRERLEREQKATIEAKQAEQTKLEQEYGLVGIENEEALQHRLEDIVSKGIFLGADESNQEKVAEFTKLKQVIPQFSEFKEFYLQLRQLGLEDKLYKGIDIKNLSYDMLLDKAKALVEEHTKIEAEGKVRGEAETDEQVTLNNIKKTEQTISAEQQTHKGIKVADRQQSQSIKYDQRPEEIARDDEPEKINGAEEEEKQKTYQERWKTYESTIDNVYLASFEEYLKTRTSQNSREEKQSERIRSKEESIKDEIGETELIENNTGMQEVNNSTVNLWMNRFSSWYSAIDRVSQNVKAKFVKMKSDIVKAISNTLRERNSQKNVQMPKQSER